MLPQLRTGSDNPDRPNYTATTSTATGTTHSPPTTPRHAQKNPPNYCAIPNLRDYNYRKAVNKVPMRKVSPASAAEAILRGVTRNDEFIVFPILNKVIVSFYRALPSVATPIMTRSGM